ncbi:MAG: hypothetical protein JSU77_00630 [Fidelibacterota bacterium]|nr:MAG: hypothetical protein JSU77_00630 [Candidatus Neomarinimicrobiota bacterium]
MLLPPLFLGTLIIAGACDFQLLESPELPRWGISLTIPLIHETYDLSDLAENDTTISVDKDSTLQIEFCGTLDTTKIDSSLLEVELPEAATTQTISETVDGISADSLITMPVEENVQIVIKLDSLLRTTALSAFYDTVSFPAAYDVNILQDDWNAYVASIDIDENEGPFQVLDTSTAFQDISFIERMRYLRLDDTPYNSKFHTTVENNGFPTSIDSIRLNLTSGSLLSVTHQKNSLLKNATYDDSTDLATEKLGSEMGFGLSMRLPVATDTVKILAGDSAKVAVTVQILVGGVDSLAITTSQASVLPEAPDPLPLPEDIAIRSGVLRSQVTSPINEVSLNGLANTLPFDILFGLTFPNFTSTPAGTDSLKFGPYTLSDGDAPIDTTNALGGYTFYNPAGGSAIEEFQYEVQAEVIAEDIALPLDGTPLGTFQVGIEFGDGDDDGKGDLHFESITGNFSLSFDAVNTTIQNIPTGFAGFQLGRLSLALLLRNQIKLPVQLDLRLVGRTYEGDSVAIPIPAYVNYPDPDGTAPDGTPAHADNGDTAYTMIILDESSVRTYWLPEGITDTNSSWWDTTVVSEGKTIVDVLNLPPDIIEVAGAAVVEGEGVVEVGKGIWGEFELIAPFAFIMPQDISFLPVAPIPLAPMAEDTREQIQNVLLSASLTSSAETNFPFGGKISMLASDTTLFTLALDYLDDIAAGIPTAARTGDTTIYSTVPDVLEADSIMDVNQFVFHPELAVAGKTSLPQETIAKKVEFYTEQGDSFWIGHLFDMELPSPKNVNNLGWVTTPGDTTQVIALDAERVGWIASDTTVYLKTFITLYGAEGLRTMQTTNWINFAAFITFNLASDILGVEEEPDSSEIQVQSIPNMILATDSTATVYLDSVFTPPEGMEVKELDLAATTSHTGIATGTIRTLRSGGVTRKVLRVAGIGPGTARVTVSADDDPDDDIDPATTSFLVTVQQAGSESMSPAPSLPIRHIISDTKKRSILGRGKAP